MFQRLPFVFQPLVAQYRALSLFQVPLSHALLLRRQDDNHG
jgi:hypothetical protein